MKTFDRMDPDNRDLYNDKAYKIINADKAFDLGLYEEKKLLKNLDPDTYKKGPHDVIRFIKRTSSAESGEKVTDLYEIDQSVIENEEKYDGFYAVATNLEDGAKTVLGLDKKYYQPKELNKKIKKFRDRHSIQLL